MNYILLAFPVFFIMIGIEYVLGLIERKKIYRLNDSINDVSMGVIDLLSSAFFSTIVIAAYFYIWDNYKLFDMGADSMWSVVGVSIWVWVLCFIAKDFVFYWAHRMSHEMNIGWATHIAHHQSEEFNLSVALRQGAFQSFFFNIFDLSLALLGFPPVVYFINSQMNTIYQFWIHTRTVGKLGPLEWVLNTPSHHRVHHGRDAKYIDKNHGGVFIVWDRMFGTFQEEEEEPDYGLVTPLQSWNPLWGQVHYLARLGKMSMTAPHWGDKVKVWYKPPAWKPAGMEVAEKSDEQLREERIRKKYDTQIPLGLSVYVLLHFVPLILLAGGFLMSEGEMEWLAKTGAAALILWGLLCLGGIMESRRWAYWAELLRIICFAGIFVFFGGALFGLPQLSGQQFDGVVLITAVFSGLWMAYYRKTFVVPLWVTREELDQAGGEDIEGKVS